MAYNWNQVYEQQGQQSAQPNNDMMLLERRAQLEAQQKQKDFENELERLRQSYEYNNSNTKKRIEMEAKLFAMQKQFLPTEMTGDLLGIPKEPQQQGQPRIPQMQQEPSKTNIGGQLGAGAGGLAGIVGRKTLPGAVGGALGKLANVADVIPAMNSSKLGGLLTKVGSKVGGKTLGKLGGAVAGGIPGFLVGTAIGEIVSKLLESDDEKDRAKAEYLINEYMQSER